MGSSRARSRWRSANASRWSSSRRAAEPDRSSISRASVSWRPRTSPGSIYPSAPPLLPERADLLLIGGGQPLQRERGGPHGALIEVRCFLEAERRVPRLELVRTLEEADDLVVLGVRGHPVPGLGRKARRALRDDRVEPLRHGAVRFRHLGDLREQGALPLLLGLGGLQLAGALLHRGSFLGREPVARAGALGGRRGALLRGWLLRHCP